MMKHAFTPNKLCRLCFGVPEGRYVGSSGLSALLDEVIGKPAAQRYLIAQDPIPGDGPGVGKIVGYFGEDRTPIDRDDYAVLGTIERFLCL